MIQSAARAVTRSPAVNSATSSRQLRLLLHSSLGRSYPHSLLLQRHLSQHADSDVHVGDGAGEEQAEDLQGQQRLRPRRGKPRPARPKDRVAKSSAPDQDDSRDADGFRWSAPQRGSRLTRAAPPAASSGDPATTTLEEGHLLKRVVPPPLPPGSISTAEPPPAPSTKRPPQSTHLASPETSASLPASSSSSSSSSMSKPSSDRVSSETPQLPSPLSQSARASQLSSRRADLSVAPREPSERSLPIFADSATESSPALAPSASLASPSQSSPSNIEQVSPWTDHPTVSRTRQVANIGQLIVQRRRDKDRSRLFKAMIRPQAAQRIAPQKRDQRMYDPSVDLIPQAANNLVRLAESLKPHEDAGDARHSLLVASYVSSAVVLSERYVPAAAQRSLGRQAGSAILDIVRPPEKADTVTVKALYAQGLALTFRHKASLLLVSSAMGDFVPTLQSFSRKGRLRADDKDLADQMRNSAELQEMARLLHIILSTRMRDIMMGLNGQEEGQPERNWRRGAAREIRRHCRAAGPISSSPAEPSEDDGDTMVSKQSKLVNLLRSLIRHGFFLSLARGIFRGTMTVFDDLINGLHLAALKPIIDETLALDDKQAALQTILAIVSSLIRQARIESAVAIYVRCHREGVLKLPEHIARNLIRASSHHRHGEVAGRVVRLLLRQSTGTKLKLEVPTWIVLCGHMAAIGQHEQYSALCRQFFEEHPEQSADPALHHLRLQALARSPRSFGQFRQHLLQHYEVPEFARPSVAPRGPPKMKMYRSAYHAAITAHGHFGDIKGARKYLDHMATTSFGQDVHAFNALLKAHRRARDMVSASSTWREMEERRIAPNEASYVTMGMLLAERGDLQAALSMFDAQEAAGIPLRTNIVVYIMSKLIHADELNTAISLFERLVRSSDAEITTDAYNCMLKVLVKRSAPYQVVIDSVQKMKKEGYYLNPDTYLLAIQSACDADRIMEAEDLFAQLDAAYQKAKARDANDPSAHEISDDEGDHKKTRVEDFFQSGVQHGHFSLLIHTHLRLGNVAAAKEYFDEMQKRGIYVNPFTWTILVRSYVATGTSSNMRLARDIVTWQIESEEARQMQHLDEPGTFTSRAEMSRFHRSDITQMLLGPLLADASKEGDLNRVESILQDISAKDITLSMRTLTAVLDARRRTDDIDGMLAIWNRIFDKSIELALEADPTSRLISRDVTSKLREARSFAPGQRFASQVKVPAVQRNALCIPLTIVIDGLASQERFDEIAEIWSTIRSYGFAFDPYNWNQLASVLARAGRVEEAVKILENVLNEMPPPDSTERQREMRRAIEVALESQSPRAVSTVRRGDDQILSPARAPRRRYEHRTSKRDDLREALGSVHEDVQGFDEDVDEDDSAEVDKEEAQSAKARERRMAAALSAKLGDGRNPFSSVNDGDDTQSKPWPDAPVYRHPIMDALQEQDAIERAGYTWRPHLQTRRDIAHALATRVGVSDTDLEQDPDAGHYLEFGINGELFSKQKRAYRVMKYHVEGQKRKLEEAGSAAAQMQRQEGRRS